MARRRSRRRKSSYREETDSSDGVPPQLVVEDLSPRARRLAESGVIDLSAISGSGESGRITSGDILHAARVMEMEQSVARIETVGREVPDLEPAAVAAPEIVPMEDGGHDIAAVVDTESVDSEIVDPEIVDPEIVDPEIVDPEIVDSEIVDSEIVDSEIVDSEIVDSEIVDPELPGEVADDWQDEVEDRAPDSLEGPSVPTHSDATTSSASNMGSGPIEVPPTPWDAYNGSSDGLAESALPGAEQSWGEAEANIAAIAEEAAAQMYGRPPETIEPPATVDSVPAAEPAFEEPAVEDGVVGEPAVVEPAAEEPAAEEPVVVEPVAEAPGDSRPGPGDEEPAFTQPTAVVAALSDIEAAVDLEPVVTEPIAEDETQDIDVPVAATAPPQSEPREAMMDFGTLELVDPESVWAEGAEDFAPWFLAHSKQLGDVLGLEAGLSEARQFTTKSATGVLGRDDNGEDVVVVSSQDAVADDSDLGRALGMAASSGAATVALVSAKFNEDQLKALSWLNNQTKSGVRWYGIEMRVVRIADSPAAMLFDLVASPPTS